MHIICEIPVDFKKIGAGLGLNSTNARKLFEDGRMLGRLAEFQLAAKYKTQRMHEHSPYDLIINAGKVEIRSLLKKEERGVCFAPASQIGAGRKLTEDGYNKKISDVDYYIAAELLSNKIRFFYVSKEDIDMMDRMGYIRHHNKSVSHTNFYKAFKAQSSGG